MSDLVDDMIGDGYYSTHEEFLEAHGEKPMPIPTEDLTKLGKALGATDPKNDKVSVRFKPEDPYKVPVGWTFLHYTETPAKTPTGGRYIRRTLVVKRNKDGRKFVGNLRKEHKNYDTVNLKPYTDTRNAEDTTATN